MIQDIFPWQLRNEYVNAAPRDNNAVLDIHDGSILTAETSLSFPTVASWRTWQKTPSSLIYAFKLERTDASAPEEQRFFLPFHEQAATIAPSGWGYKSINQLREASPGSLAFAAVTAGHLYSWYVSTRFCGHCGTAMQHGTRERCMLCPSCGHIVYPRISPSVIVAVTDGDRLLMTRYAHGNTAKLVLVAGFVEIGETAEQAAAREVLEETGVRIKNIRYCGSQPWGFSGVLTLGFSAELDGPDTLSVDTTELAEACWIHRRDIPPYTGNSSLTMHLVTRFRQGFPLCP